MERIASKNNPEIRYHLSSIRRYGNMAKASMKTRKEIIDKQRANYRKSTKKGKGAILDAICETTGLSRDRAKKLLSGGAKRQARAKKKRGRKPVYGQDVREALEKVWAFMDFASGKRLVAGMEDMLEALSKFGEVNFPDEVNKKLCALSASTADRLLVRAKSRYMHKGMSTTKPGTLLKNDIPIRLGTEWDDAIPGYVECDLVAHCGDTTAGEYVNTLDVTDIATTWTETEVVINKAQIHVFKALMTIEERQPFPYLGIDSDNGSEFINNHLHRYCAQNKICFTRSRPYMKNDNCHVEQKNWNIVRRNIGYGRYEGEEAVRVMNEYYSLLRLYTNHFLPSTKLISKERVEGKYHKRYEKPLTPYRRVLASQHIPDEEKEKLKKIHASLNPAELLRGMMELSKELEKLRMKQ
jgi:hypothetical protein